MLPKLSTTETEVTVKKVITCIAAGAALLLALIGVVALLDEPQPTASHRAAASDQVPPEYRDLVDAAGSICEGITPGLIAAQIAQESGWNPTITSPVGAAGIAQFMPATWASVGQDYNGDGTANVTDPADAIPAQGHYMCDQLAQVQAAIDDGQVSGDPVTLALAAYNAGFGAVLNAGGIPAFSETQHYVEIITANAPDYETNTTTTQGTASGDITDAIAWAQSIAADNSYAYVWGGEGAADGGYDCSGLTQEYASRLGVSLPHLADAQAGYGTTVNSLAEAQPGDLLFWGSGTYHHVAIYAGDNMMISADSEATGINYEPIWGTVTLIKRIA